jgi:hypothetical protein
MKDYPISNRQRNHRRPAPNGFHEEKTLLERSLQIERKNFSLAIKENHLGKFIRIREQGGFSRHAIVIPEAGWREFASGLSELLATYLDAAEAPGTSQEHIPVSTAQL